MAYRKNMVERHRKEFKDARFYANAPYKGPNFNSACKPHCKESLYNTKDVDARMFKIISAYEKSQAEPKAKIVYHNLAESKSSTYHSLRVQVLLTNSFTLQGSVAIK